MEEYFGVAKELGITQQEVETIQSIVMAVAGGRVRAQFCEARGLRPPGPGTARGTHRSGGARVKRAAPRQRRRKQQTS